MPADILLHWTSDSDMKSGMLQCLEQNKRDPLQFYPYPVLSS
jgi:hypothetical protein